MATFRQRDGRWQAIIRRVDLKATRTFDRLTDAKAWARGLERDADLGKAPGQAANATLAQLIDRYEREMWPTKRWGRSKTSELNALRRDLGARPVAMLSQAAVLTYARGLEITGGQIAARLSYLRDVLRTANDLWGMRVPLAEIDSAIGAARRMKIASRSGVRTRRPTPEEIDRIVAHADQRQAAMIDIGDIVRVLSVLPLRLGELLDIQWEDLNEARRTVLLRGRKHPDVTVRESRVDEVPLIAFGGLDSWALIAGRPRYLPSPFPYKRNSVSTIFHDIALKLQILDLHLHDLRAYSMSRLLEAGVPIPQVALLSGHRNWKVLARAYARLDPVSVHDTLKRLS